MVSSSGLTVEEYNEGVYYCRRCHSLYIIQDASLTDGEWDGSYCGKCNSTDIGECKFGDWLAEEGRRKQARKKMEWSR